MFKKLRRRRLRTAIALTLIVPPSAAFAWYPMTIFFEKDSVAFSNEAEIVLKAAKWSICYRGMMDVEIEADSDRDEHDPDALSQRRAEAVRGELYRLGLARTVRLRIHAIGTENPMSFDDARLNRRVVISVPTSSGPTIGNFPWPEKDSGICGDNSPGY